MKSTTWLKLITLALVIAGLFFLVGCPPAPPVEEPAPPVEEVPPPEETAPAKKYEGVTLRMLAQGGVSYEPALKKFAEEFQQQTGAKVEIEWAPWEELMPKLMASIQAGGGLDIFVNDIEFQYTVWADLLPIQDYIKKTNYDMNDLLDPCLKYGEGIGGQPGVRYGLPLMPGVSVVIYRTDLIPQLPTTWDEYLAVLEKNTKPPKYGSALAGVWAQLVKAFLARYWALGDPLLTPDWKPLINSDNGVKALELLKKQVDEYSPPGMLAWDNPDAAIAFLHGDVAVHEGWTAFIVPSLLDPDKSKVGDNWAIGRYPEGGTGNFVQHNMVILKTTNNPDAAFDFIAYCTNAQQAKRLALEFGVDPARKSVYTDPDVLAKMPYMKDYLDVLLIAKPFTPGVPYWLEMFIPLGENVSKYLAGELSAKAALDAAAAKWEELIKQSPLPFEYKE